MACLSQSVALCEELRGWVSDPPVAVLLRGPFHGDRVQYKFGVLEPNN